MKTKCTLLWLVTVLFIFNAMAQAPQSFNYQAVARNETLQPYPNQSISLLMSIVKDSPSGLSVYIESHEVTTNEIGLFDLQIGQGIPISGDFSSIDWGSGSYFLQAEIDLEGGTNYELLGASQLLSVPYALYAENSPLSQPNLSLVGNQLSISGGNAVELPILSSFWQASGSDIFYNRGNALIGTPGTVPALQLSPVNLNIWGPDSLVSSYTAGFLGLFNSSTSGKLELGYNKQRFWNAAGQLSASIDGEFGGFASFFEGNLRASLGRNKMGTGSIATYGTNNELNFLVDYANNAPNAGLMATLSDGDFRTVATVTSDGAGVLATFGPGGNRNILLGNSIGGADAGSIEMYNQGSLIVEMGRDPNDAGFVTTYGPDSTTNVDLISLPGSPEIGAVTTFSDSRLRTILSTNADDAGLLETYGPADQTLVSITSATNNPDAGVLSIEDSGQETVELIGDTFGELGLFGANGSENVILSANLTNDNVGIIGTFSPTGQKNVVLSMVENDPEAGAITTYKNGKMKTLVTTTQTGKVGAIGTFGEDSSLLVKITAAAKNPKVGGIVVYGENDSKNVELTSAEFGPSTGVIQTYTKDDAKTVVISGGFLGNAGLIETFGVNDSKTTSIGSGGSNHEVGKIVLWGKSGGANVSLSNALLQDNHGSITVHDRSGLSQAGVFVDDNGDGVVYGDIKSFRAEYQSDTEKEIVYACIEGPEAAAYMRGTNRLSDGEATISFPPHFQQIADFRTMTVMITPLSAESKGLAVIDKNASGFKVSELLAGEGNYEFDWEVKCVRNGFQDFKVIQDKFAIKQHDELEDSRN